MKQLTILVCPFNGVGHVNACRGTVSKLLSRGHQVVFVVERAWSGKLSPSGLTEHLYSVPSQADKQTATHLAEWFLTLGCFGPNSKAEKMLGVTRFFESPHVSEEWALYNEAIAAAITQYKPDLIITDESGLMPAIAYSGLPWIRHFSTNPTFFVLDEELPPGGSGLPYDDRSQWEEFNTLRAPIFTSAWFNDYIQTLGYPRYPENARTPPTESLIVYACPEEWNYPPLRSRSHWFNLEVFNKNEAQEVIDLASLLPSDFLADTLNGNFSGKLMYVSMGSMGAIDLDLMARLLKALANSRHKFIVSKGPLAEQYEVAGSNQWGDRFLPQTSLLPLVDLVITHGGNNSVTEIFAQGKPMIVLPLFADQFDNAQRLEETGYGVKIDPYNFTEAQLNDAIDSLLDNEKLKAKLVAASMRIQATDRHEAFALKVEEMLSK